jgi:GT2 family glycosyltransferase
MRPLSLLRLLESVKTQSRYPNEIIIVDGSTNDETKEILEINSFLNLIYFQVNQEQRGLTKQRNFGIKNIAKDSEIICFLDDDTILENNYFDELLKTHLLFPKALGIGGYITNETQWEPIAQDYHPKFNEFVYDGWKQNDGVRFRLRKFLGLDSDLKPGYMPEFSHGRSVSFLPPSGKIYQVEQLMGGVSSFKKVVFDKYHFSTYFEGYGLYEDADFTLRISKQGELYINTNAKLSHHHDQSGRPNKYNYGKMVIRNGWYVWRVKHPEPKFIARLKWNTITLLLILIRFSNILNTKNRKEALTESVGRIIGWLSLIVNKPKIEK